MISLALANWRQRVFLILDVVQDKRLARIYLRFSFKKYSKTHGTRRASFVLGESLSKVIHGNFINWRISFAGIPKVGSAGRHLCVKMKTGIPRTQGPLIRSVPN